MVNKEQSFVKHDKFYGIEKFIFIGGLGMLFTIKHVQCLEIQCVVMLMQCKQLTHHDVMELGAETKCNS